MLLTGPDRYLTILSIFVYSPHIILGASTQIHRILMISYEPFVKNNATGNA